MTPYDLGLSAPVTEGSLISLSSGLYLESKFDFEDKTPVQSVMIDAQAALEFNLHDSAGWTRLGVITDQSAETGNLLALRLIVQTIDEPILNPLALKAMLAKSNKQRRRNTVAASLKDLRIEQPGRYALTGLFALPAAGEDRLDMLLDLPRDSGLTLLSVQIDWLHATLSREAQNRLEDCGGEALSPFQLSALPQDQALAAAISQPHLISSKYNFSGFNLVGHLVSVPAITSVTVASPSQEEVCALSKSVTLAPGIDLVCGFESNLLNLVQSEDDTEVRLILPNSDAQPFSTQALPGPVRQMLLNASGIFAKPKEAPAAQLRELYFYPDYSSTNPYQKLMYANMPGTLARGGTLADAIERLEAQAAPGSVVLHLHWLNPLLAGASTAQEAERKRSVFREKLRHFTRLGGIVLWTVHNTVSHDAQFRDAEIGLGQDVADLASRIHVHSTSLLPTLASCYDLPAEKLLIQPHPNYIGVYPDYVTRSSARRRLNLPETAKVILFIGQLRPYKGIEHLARDFARLAKAHPDAYLLIAGKPVHPYVPGVLSRVLQVHQNVRVVEGFIPDTELQWYYHAADWVALPYLNILTSGSLLAAMSFSRPCIAPQMGMIGDVLTHGKDGLLYDPADPQGLALALEQALNTQEATRVQMQSAALEAVQPLGWDKMGTALQEACDAAAHPRKVTVAFDDGERECLLFGPAFPPAKLAKTAVIILNYEHVDDVQRLIGTLRASDSQDFDLYVVDNASPSLSPYELSQAFPLAHLLCIPENVGYAAGNNAAMRLIEPLDYEFIWILNPDMVVSPQALGQHVAAAALHPKHSIFGATILRDETERKVASAGCYITLDGGLTTGHMYAGEEISVLPQTPFEADFITGASVFLRKKALATLGLIPEDYFLYFEETHWLLQASKQGMKSLVLPEVTLAHYKRSEEDGMPAKYYFYYYIRNALLFYRRITGNDPSAIRDNLQAGFIATWLKKIEALAPAALPIYRLLAETALAHGMAGVSGQTNLFALEYSAQSNTPEPTDTPALVSFAANELGKISGHICIFDEKPLSGVQVSVLVNGRLATTLTSQPIQDAANMQQWSISGQLPNSYLRNNSLKLELVLNGRPMINGTKTVYFPNLPPKYQARIDGITTYLCNGWALNLHDTSEKPEVEILFEGKVIARTTADIFRPDLLKNGVGDGYAAFNVRLPRMFSDGQKRKIALRLAGKTEILFEREVVDSRVMGGAKPMPADQALSELFYQRHIWLAKHDLDQLPLGQLVQMSEASLAASHAQRPETELVSIIMPAFNRADTIVPALDSIRAQSYDNWELLVIDDGSSDNTVAVLEDYIAQTGDKRIRLIILAQNQGVSAARNAGLREAKGEVIAYLDSDNIWLPDFLRIMVGELMAQPKPGSAYCGQRIIQVCGLPEAPIEELVALRLAPFHLPLMENRNFIDLNCFVHHRRLYETLGGFAEEIRRLVDWELILRYSRIETPHYVMALLSNYYFDKAQNQITKLESFGPNLRELTRLSAAHAKKPTPKVALRPLHIGLIGTEKQSVATLVERALEIQTSMDPAVEVKFVLSPAAKAPSEAYPYPLPPEIEVITAESEGDQLHLISATRKADADLLLLSARAMPQQGWLAHMNEAIAQCPEGGLFTSRRMIMGRQVPANAKAIPFAHATHDACIALSADQRTVLDASFKPELNMIELTKGNSFFSYIPSKYANKLHLGAVNNLSLPQQIDLLSQLIRSTQKAKIIYCGDVEVYEL